MQHLKIPDLQETVMRIARQVFEKEELDVRLQPRPNEHPTEVYQLHTRPKAMLTLGDTEWKLIQEGPLDRILKSLRVDYGGK